MHLTGKGGGQHAGKELERDRQQQLHEGDEDEHGERHQPEQVGYRSNQLSTKRYNLFIITS